MDIVNYLKYDVWKDFVDNHPQGNIFHTPEMFEVYSGARGYHPFLWAVIENGRVLALHLPVQITLVGGPFHYLTTRDVDFGGVLVDNSEQGRRGLALLLQEYNQHIPGAPLFTELRNLADQCQIQDILENHGYVYEDHLNYLLDLRRDTETILQSFTKSTRNRIRKSRRKGDIIVREVTERTMLPLFYELLLKTFKTVYVPLADISLFETAFDVLRPKDMAYFTIAYLDGAPAAAQVSILYKDVVFGWYNGIDRSVKGDYNEVTIWNVIKWAAKNGYGVLDFGGAGKPGEKYGVRDFKAKFRGKLVNYGRNTRVHAPWRMKISQKAYQVARDSLYILGRLGTGFSISPAK
jgi:serine/alanine adding enzyme